MALKAILCDLDGTLVDSAEDISAALNQLLSELGRRRIGVDEVKGMVGDGVGNLIERALAATGGDPASAADLVPRFLALYEPIAARATRPYPEVPETLRTLKARRLRLAVVTNKLEAPTHQILRGLGLDRFIDAVVGGDTLAERKPHPAPVVFALKTLGVDPAEAVMVGDNYHDVQSARAAGVRTIAVTYGYSHVPHDELGADRLIGSFSQLFEVLPD